MQFRSSTTVNDAMKQVGTMHHSIKPVYSGIELIGTAFTVYCQPGGIITCHKALAEAPKDSILVIDGHGYPNDAIWGGLMSIEAKEKGFKGVVIDGAIRDLQTIKELEFPVFARNSTPRVGKNKELGTLGLPISCGGTVVNTGDLIIGDDDGVVVIPQDNIQDILQAADNIDEKEDEIAEQVKKGGNIGQILGLFAE